MAAKATDAPIFKVEVAEARNMIPVCMHIATHFFGSLVELRIILPPRWMMSISLQIITASSVVVALLRYTEFHGPSTPGE